jgi:TolB protein
LAELLPRHSAGIREKDRRRFHQVVWLCIVEISQLRCWALAEPEAGEPELDVASLGRRNIWGEILVRRVTKHLDCDPNDLDDMTRDSEADKHMVCRVFDRLLVQVNDATVVAIVEHFRELQLLDGLQKSFRPHARKILAQAESSALSRRLAALAEALKPRIRNRRLAESGGSAMKVLSASAAALLAALTLLVIAPGASATFSGENGRIVFGRNTGHVALFTVRPNGEGLFRLTNPPGSLNTFSADWSPNGRWLAYERLGEDVRGYIFRIRRDGTHRQNLSKKSCLQKCLAEHMPAWSPDATHIAYVRESFSALGRVYVKDEDGTGEHQVVPSRPRTRDYGPQWSPSGKRLVFARSDFRRGKSAVFTIRVDGTRLHRITPWRMNAGGSLDWSPNGRWVLFQNHTGGVHLSTIWLMRPNGENRHPITTTAGGTVTWESGSFSPDGQRIVVVQGASISVLSKRGDILQTITASAVDGDPDWGSRPK